ncbi:sensor histidine kinase [Allorhizobium borbori]|uniref:histidine kinase n=1 Tax=Allorhizobium borbori TaxID=485907 RepID=A0A7W6JY42_9HYPH|nr:HAMP domain-containing sensor histidine kinase [Allorhizobium borbori]MBB4101699.1 signal transduction histidine kinase [Allorhizobium borbori]
MRSRSLRWRLLLAGAVAIFSALALSAIVLAILFDRHVERVAVSSLNARALALVAMVEPGGPAGATIRKPPADPLYDQPFSGHYWQIALGGEIHRSRSLWDHQFSMAADGPVPGKPRTIVLEGPRKEALVAVEHALRVGSGKDAVPLRIIVAADRSEIAAARRAFLGDLVPYIAVLAALLLAASWAQITVGLRPLAQIGQRIAGLNSGGPSRIGQDLPTEVIPLASELDALLDARDRELERARHRAGDLAHGFKTPLQALLGDAQRLRDQGEDEISGSIEDVVAAMRRLVDRELARARIRSNRNPGFCDPAALLRKVIAVLRKTPRGRDIDWRIEVENGLSARIDADDLTEALGALLENAMRHARDTVTARAAAQKGRVVITIEDDGTGVPDGDLLRLVERGVRLDESGEGQGIGLAIVADIVEAARGTLAFSNASPGLRAEISLAAGPGGDAAGQKRSAT